jgi:prepilin-type processing-associated H-X9-DG protein/prepilin-type N-terminal cleavage/methylation domain-containing protein
MGCKHCEQVGEAGKVIRRQLLDSFTLIELLVVVAITAILASLLMPALSRAKSQAKAVKCQNNLRQLGLALGSFACDFGVFPLGIGGFPESPEHKSLWMDSLAPYITGWVATMEAGTNAIAAVFRCPIETNQLFRPEDIVLLHYGYNRLGVVMTEPYGLGGDRPYDFIESSLTPRTPTKENEVLKPTDMLAFGDGFFGANGKIGMGFLEIGRVGRLDGFQDYTDHAFKRHSGKLNYAFVDGHVAAEPVQKTLISLDEGDLEYWNKDQQPHTNFWDIAIGTGVQGD